MTDLQVRHSQQVRLTLAMKLKDYSSVFTLLAPHLFVCSSQRAPCWIDPIWSGMLLCFTWYLRVAT